MGAYRIFVYSLCVTVVAALFQNCYYVDRGVNGNTALLPTPVKFQPLIPPDGNTPMIVMSRGENAFGKGPVFKISIFGDGRFVYEPASDHPMPSFGSEKPTPAPTPSQRTITQLQLGDIVQHVSAMGFLSMRDRYVDTSDGCPHVVSDQPSISLTLNLRSGQQKTIQHYLGCLDDPSLISSVYPSSLKELENTILNLAK